MDDRYGLGVTNPGEALPRELKPGRGMGLRIMKYRAGEIGATLQVRGERGKGTTVLCIFNKDL